MEAKGWTNIQIDIQIGAKNQNKIKTKSKSTYSELENMEWENFWKFAFLDLKVQSVLGVAVCPRQSNA